MRFLAPVLILFTSVLALANNPNCERFSDPNRKAECYAYYGGDGGAPPDFGNTYPGDRYYPPHRPPQQPPYYPPPPHHYQPPPPNHYQPPPPPNYYPPTYPPHYGSDVYGPQRTVRWLDLGVNRVPKLVSETMSYHVGGRLVNEILIRALDNRIQIESVVAILSNGQYVDLRNLQVSIRGGSEIRTRADSYYSLRVQRLEVRATSSNLIGSRASFQLLLGLAD